MALKISRVAHHMHAADVPGFCRHQNYIFFGKNRDLQEKAPCRARPHRRGKTTALVVLLPLVVHGTRVVGLIMFG